MVQIGLAVRESMLHECAVHHSIPSTEMYTSRDIGESDVLRMN